MGAAHKSYQITGGEYYYIRKRDSPVLEQHPSEMTM